MSDLSQEARALLRRVAPADEPTAADQARVLGLIAGSIAAPVAGDGGAAGAGTAGAGTVAAGGTLKLVIAFAVSVGVGGLATTAATRTFRHEPRAVAAPVVTAAVAKPAPAAAAPVVPEAEVAPEVEPQPERKAAPPRAHAAPVGPAPATVETPPVAAPLPRPAVARDEACELPAELASLQQAQRALAADPAEAVAVLEGFAARCPAGALIEERLATRALALCLADQRTAGRAAGQELAERFPASPSLARVKQSCGP